jgi:hypothetical protein
MNTSNASKAMTQSNSAVATAGITSSSSILLPNGDSSFSERQRIIGARGLLEKAIKIEITFDSIQKKTVFTNLGDDSDYGGFLAQIVHRLERDINIPAEAYTQKLHGLLLYEVIWTVQTADPETAPSNQRNPVTPRLNRKKGTKLEQVNKKFDSVLKASLAAITPPDRLNQGPIIAQFAFIFAFSGGSPYPNWNSGLIGDFIKPCSDQSSVDTGRICLWELTH